MTPEHKRKMAAGRARWLKEQEREAKMRVEAFKAWLAKGSPLTGIPPIPSDADYRMAS